MMDLAWLEQFPALVDMEQSARELLAKSARIIEAPINAHKKSKVLYIIFHYFALWLHAQPRNG